jgi:cytochrome c
MSFEINKIAGAILASMMLAMISGIIANMLVHPKPLDHPVYMVATAAPKEAQPAAGGQPAQQAKADDGGVEPIAPLLAAASPDAGKDQARKCSACHTFDKGGPNRIGPNLYNVVDEPIAEGRNGFAFSPALEAHKGEKWTIDNLNRWLFKPQGFAKGTKMTFAGLSNAKDRADVVAYLNSLSDSPKPLTAGK